jgi:hypothetical protein
MAELVILLLALPGVLASADGLRFRGAVWRAAGYPRPVWIGLILALPFLGWIGGLIYFIGVRPNLTRSARPPWSPLASGA